MTSFENTPPSTYGGEIDYSFPSVNNTVTIYNSKTDILEITGTDKKPYYQITYIGDSNVNVTLYPHANNALTSKTNYTVSYMYFFAPIHSFTTAITGTAGELVFALTDTMNNKIYVSFLLTNTSGTSSSNEIDKIVALIQDYKNSLTSKTTTIASASLTPDMMNPINSSLNNDAVSKPTGIRYVSSNGAQVLVITTPITINDTTKAFLSALSNDTSKLFKPNYTTYQKSTNLVNLVVDVQTNGNNNNEDQIYIDCNPVTDAAGDAIKPNDVNFLSMPLQNAIANQETVIDFYKTSINFYLFAVGVVFAWFVVPRIYKKIVIDKINKSVVQGERPNYMLSADIVIFFITLMYCLTSIWQTYDDKMKVGSIFVFILYILSTMLIISYIKLDPDFLETNPGNERIILAAGTYAQLQIDYWSNLLGSIGRAFLFILYGIIGNRSGELLNAPIKPASKLKNNIIAGFIMFWLFLSIIITSALYKDDGQKWFYYATILCFYAPVSVVVLFLLLTPDDFYSTP